MRKALALSFLSVLAGISGFAPSVLAGSEVNIYSSRRPDLIKPALDLFTKETGITANVLFLDKGLIERIKAEGENSPADVILTLDVNRLDELKQDGVTQAIADPQLAAAIPAKFRDPDGQWIGLSMDMRVIYAARNSVKVKSLHYEDLADPQWKGKVCLRDGRHASNLGLFADRIAAHGADATEKWLAGVKANLAGRPSGSDASQVEAIAQGKCALALGNATVIAAMRSGSPEERKAAAAVRVLYPDSRDKGGYANISGLALTKYAPNRDNALKLMRFLATKKAQEIYAQRTLEYPVVAGVLPAKVVRAFGTPKADSVPLSDVIRYRDQAAALVDKTGFNDGPGN